MRRSTEYFNNINILTQYTDNKYVTSNANIEKYLKFSNDLKESHSNYDAEMKKISEEIKNIEQEKNEKINNVLFHEKKLFSFFRHKKIKQLRDEINVLNKKLYALLNYKMKLKEMISNNIFYQNCYKELIEAAKKEQENYLNEFFISVKELSKISKEQENYFVDTNEIRPGHFEPVESDNETTLKDDEVPYSTLRIDVNGEGSHIYKIKNAEDIFSNATQEDKKAPNKISRTQKNAELHAYLKSLPRHAKSSNPRTYEEKASMQRTLS